MMLFLLGLGLLFGCLKTLEIMLVADLDLVASLVQVLANAKSYWWVEYFALANLLWLTKIQLKNKVRIRHYDLHRHKQT